MSHHFFFIVFFSVLFFLATNAQNQMDPSCTYVAKPPLLGGTEIPTFKLCKYELFIRTGQFGTSSKIGITFNLSAAMRPFGPFVVPDLSKCGGANGEPAGAVYFQADQTNGFVLQGPCELVGCPPAMREVIILAGGNKAILTSDGSGSDWSVQYVRLEISRDGVQIPGGGENYFGKVLSKNGALSVPVDFCAIYT